MEKVTVATSSLSLLDAARDSAGLVSILEFLESQAPALASTESTSSFLTAAKQVKGRGDGIWTQNVAKAFGSCLRSWKALSVGDDKTDVGEEESKEQPLIKARPGVPRLLNREILGVFNSLAKHIIAHGEKHGWGDNFGAERDLAIHTDFRGCPGFSDPLLILQYTGEDTRLDSITLINDPDEGFDEMGGEEGKKFCRIIEKLWKISPQAFVASIFDSLEKAYAYEEDCVCVNINLEDYLGDELSQAVLERLSKERVDAKRRSAEFEEQYLE